MNNSASTGLISLFLISIIFLATAAISNEIIFDTNDETLYNIDEYEELLDDTIKEISTYFNIKQVLGKYYNYENTLVVKKIVILIKLYFDINFDLSDLNILISNGEKSLILQYNNEIANVESYDVFEHPNWNKIINGYYSILIISDKDNSILDYNNINDNTDMIYITIIFPDYFNFEKGDTIEVSFLPNSGIVQNLKLKAPLPINKIVNLYS